MERSSLFALVTLAVAGITTGGARADMTCSDYSNFAIRDARKAGSANCGFTGPRWSLDRSLHQGFCVDRKNAGDENALVSETNIRKAELRQCETSLLAKCTAYARAALADVAAANQIGCGDQSGRWSTNEATHYGYCMGRLTAGDTTGPANEPGYRAAELAQCKARKAAEADGGGGSGGGGANSFSVVADVTGYDAPEGNDKCYLGRGDAGQLLNALDGNPRWLLIQGTTGGCAGQQAWVYNQGELEF